MESFFGADHHKLPPKGSKAFYKELKKIQRNQYNNKYYGKKKRCTHLSNSKDAVWKRTQREMKTQKKIHDAEKRHKTREKVRRHRERVALSRTLTVDFNTKTPFSNRMAEFRALKQLKSSLPETPKRRASVLKKYLRNSHSPTVQTLEKHKIVKSPDEQETELLSASVIEDIKTVVNETKKKRSKDAATCKHILFTAISGEAIEKQKCKTSLAKKLCISRKQITRGKQVRTRVLKSDSSCWSVIVKKNRNNAISNENKRTAYEFWLLKGISRPTGNKKDIKRERLGPKVYASHMIHVLEKTQTEVYLDFVQQHPDIKMSQRSFERLKPFYVRPVRSQDRNTCCCRYHTEFQTVFKQCMAKRKRFVESKESICTKDIVFPLNIYEAVELTLCKKEGLNEEYEKDCINRNCKHCGVHKFDIMADESDMSENAKNVEWEKFEYVPVVIKGNQVRKKLLLVKKSTKIGELFSYFQHLLSTFAAHQFRSKWQNQQMRTLLSNLPQNDCMCVHDFSENYRCSNKNEIQTAYFQKTEVSIHVTILHRHAILEVDGKESTAENPQIITEQSPNYH